MSDDKSYYLVLRVTPKREGWEGPLELIKHWDNTTEWLDRVISIHEAPKLKACKCGRKPHTSNWRPNSKHVPVCTICKKPSRFWFKGIVGRLEMALGRNLLVRRPK